MSGLRLGKSRRTGGAELQPVERHRSVAQAEAVVEKHAERDDQRAAVGERRLGAEETPQRRDNAAERAAQRHDAGERMNAMRRVAQQPVALARRFRDEAEFAGFQIFEAAVDKPRRRRARAGAPVGLVDDQAIDALQREIAEHAGAVDPAADHQHVRCGVAPQPGQRFVACRVGGLRHAERPLRQTGRSASTSSR